MGHTFVRWLLLLLSLTLLFACAQRDNADPEITSNILFVGDVNFADSYRIAHAMLEDVGYDRPLEKLGGFLETADTVVGNLGSPLTTLRQSRYDRRKKYIHWSNPQPAADAFARHNMLNFSLANNHAMDFDVQGLKHTWEAGAKAGLNFFGAGLTPEQATAPMIKTLTAGQRQVTVAIFAGFEYREKYDKQYSYYVSDYNPGVSKLDEKETAQRIQQYRAENPDAFIVVFPHWGMNYAWRSDNQVALAHSLVDAGANLLIGHGAHRVQEIERYKRGWIVYNLGNFMFNSPGRYQKLRQAPLSLAAFLQFGSSEEALFTRLRLYPLFTDNRVTKYRSRPVTEQEFSDLQDLLLDRESDVDFSDSHVGNDELGWYFDLDF